MNTLFVTNDIVAENYLLHQKEYNFPADFKLSKSLQKSLITLSTFLIKEISDLHGLKIKTNIQYANFDDLALFKVTRDIYFLRRFLYELSLASLDKVQRLYPFYGKIIETLPYAVAQRNQFVLREYAILLNNALMQLIEKESFEDNASLFQGRYLAMQIEEFIQQLLILPLRKNIAECISLLLLYKVLLKWYKTIQNTTLYRYNLEKFTAIYKHTTTLNEDNRETDCVTLLKMDPFFQLKIQSLEEFAMKGE